MSVVAKIIKSWGVLSVAILLVLVQCAKHIQSMRSMLYFQAGLGACPPRKILKISATRLNLEAILANHSNEIVSSYYSRLPYQSRIIDYDVTKCIYWGALPLSSESPAPLAPTFHHHCMFTYTSYSIHAYTMYVYTYLCDTNTKAHTCMQIRMYTHTNTRKCSYTHTQTHEHTRSVYIVVKMDTAKL